MQTREQELAELESRIAETQTQRDNARTEAQRAKLDRQITAARTEGQRLINERHNRLALQQAHRQAALAQLDMERETQIRAELRSKFPGRGAAAEADFERLYPQLRDRYLLETTLARAGDIEPAMRPNIVI